MQKAHRTNVMDVGVNPRFYKRRAQVLAHKNMAAELSVLWQTRVRHMLGSSVAWAGYTWAKMLPAPVPSDSYRILRLILEASARTINFKVAKQIWQHHTAVSRNIPPKGKALGSRR